MGCVNNIDSIYSKSFYTHMLTTKKYNFLKRKAARVLSIKNSLSSIMHENPMFYLEHSKIDSIKYWNSVVQEEYNKDGFLSGQDIQNAIADTSTALSNRHMVASKRIQFKIVNKITHCYYKRKTKNNNKGDLKEIKYKRKSTKFTKIMTYIARRRKTKKEIEYLIENTKDKTKLFFMDVLDYMNKYSEKRLLDLGNMKYKNSTKHLKNPIEFKELSFRSTDQSTKGMVKYNTNFNSCINSFVELNGQSEYKPLYVPVKFSKEYHKHHNLYGSKNASYIIKILDNNQVRMVLSYKDTREVPVMHEEDDILGVDINVKNNLFSTSLEEEIDYDRDMFNGYVKFLKKIDKRKEKKLNNKLSKEKNKWLVRIQDMLKRKAGELVNLAIKEGKNHIVLENLELMNSGFSRNEEFMGFKYNRLVRLLHLASLKEYIKSIAYKKGIVVTFVHPHYTSQTCRSCGSISKSNRKTQEVFECISCSYACNADLNASINIMDRVHNEELRSKLLLKNKLGELRPRKLKQYQIKDIVGEAYCIIESA